MKQSIYSQAELGQYRGKWIIVQASIRMFGLEQLCGRLVEIRDDGFELVCAGHRAFICTAHVVAVMVPVNQDDFALSGIEASLKKGMR